MVKKINIFKTYVSQIFHNYSHTLNTCLGKHIYIYRSKFSVDSKNKLLTQHSYFCIPTLVSVHKKHMFFCKL